MENMYLFVIWNKALFCKKKIVNDLKSSFEIVYSSYIEWSKNHFIENLEAMYGRKLGDPIDKIGPCGTGKFFVVVVKDNNPKFEQRKQYDGYELVNSNIYDKKALYRKWTAGSHRIHCSVDEQEFKHDIAVFFGQSIINETKINTKGVRGFDSIEDFENCLTLFSNPKIIKQDKSYFIFTKCRYDLIAYLRCKEITKNTYSLNIRNEMIKLYIFGEIDEDIKSDLTDDDIKTIINNYTKYIASINSINPARISSKYSIKDIIIRELKLIIAKLKYR